MIVIKVTSEVVEVTRRFRKDGTSIRFLKQIKRLHNTAADSAIKPKRSQFQGEGKGWIADVNFKKALKAWKNRLINPVPVKIEITHEPVCKQSKKAA